jgi:molybdopterin biosynthesis enzyme MoaB
MIVVVALAWSDTISDVELILLSGGTGVAAVIVEIFTAVLRRAFLG